MKTIKLIENLNERRGVMLTLFVAIGLTIITAINSCQSPSTNEQRVSVKIEEPKAAPVVSVETTPKVVNAEEWQTFKEQSESKITRNRQRIGYFRVALKKIGKTLNPDAKTRLAQLEMENKSLSQRIANYDKNQGDFETFKQAFNHDISEVGTSLNDYYVENKQIACCDFYTWSPF